MIVATGCLNCAEIGYAGVMGVSTFLLALAGVGAFLAAVVAGVLIVVGRDSGMSERARRFLRSWWHDDREL